MIGRALAPAVVRWETGRGPIPLDRPRIAGILNVTPDSFSDGGRYLNVQDALDHADRMVAAGADLIDIGAESTRPGRPQPVSPEEEWRRLAPVLEALVRRIPETPLSVDTVKAETAERALTAGAWIINDVSGLRHDPRLADVCAGAGAGLVLMHSRGALAEMATYDHATYDDLMADVKRELAQSVLVAESRGVARARIAIDPGLGFAKRPEHSFLALDRLGQLADLGCPMLVGPSRKRFLGTIAGAAAAGRDGATAAACVAAYERGAHLFRVHDVALAREALDVAYAIRASARPAAG